MASISTAATLSSLVNSYSVKAGPPKTIIVPKASQLAALQEVTITGTLLKKQIVTLDLASGKRTANLAAHDGEYKPTPGDGDLHFCLGTKQLSPHVACELQNAKAFIPLFKNAVGSKISVTGFFRCLFEHPGFRANDDAHCFEIHPVRAVTINGTTQPFDVDVPDQDSIHTWVDPNPLNDQDSRIKVKYDKTKDTLTFDHMAGQDENYVRVSGSISQIKLSSIATKLSSFVLTSAEIGHPITAYCMSGTTAVAQLNALKKIGATQVDTVVLRNIDLPQALKGKYTINLLAIDIKNASPALSAISPAKPAAWLV
jgi:hypothetical protein